MNTVLGVFLVFAFSFKDELLQYIIIPSDDTENGGKEVRGLARVNTA